MTHTRQARPGMDEVRGGTEMAGEVVADCGRCVVLREEYAEANAWFDCPDPMPPLGFKIAPMALVGIECCSRTAATTGIA